MNKKILILSTTYGQGHMATATAIEQGLNYKYPNKYNIEIIDFTESISSLLNKTSKRLYDDTTKYTPSLYKLFFETTDYKTPIKAFNELNYRISREKIKELFELKKPDLIICNSPHWQYIISLARDNELNKVPLVSVITDSITLHTAWAVGNSDAYIVPNHETFLSLHNLGVSKDLILELGYPVKLEFNQPKFNSTKFLQTHQIDPTIPIILYLAAGNRPLAAKKTVRSLRELISTHQLLVITGRDKPLYKRLHELENSMIKVISWTNNMPEFILSSQIVITKAGGSTVMECLAAKKPIVINKIIPGQEEGNAFYFSENKLGIVALEPELISVATKKIIKNYQAYLKSINQHSQPKASLNIARFINSLLQK